jgi:hypothetical protein
MNHAIQRALLTTILGSMAVLAPILVIAITAISVAGRPCVHLLSLCSCPPHAWTMSVLLGALSGIVGMWAIVIVVVLCCKPR